MIVTSHRPNQDGYIRMFRSGTLFYLNRLVCERRHGPLGELESVHSCDNRACINPDHLSPGTHRKNMDDAVSRKRMKHGEQHPFAKLTRDMAKSVFDASGTYAEIGNRFGIGKAQVGAIKRKQKWKSIH